LSNYSDTVLRIKKLRIGLLWFFFDRWWKSLSSKQELIRLVGHRENVGHKLVREDSAAEFEKTWRSEVRASPAAKLVQERDLGAVLFVAMHEADASEGTLTVPNAPDMTLALLRSARKEALSQTFGSRAVRRTPRLDWDGLTKIYGDESTLRQRIEELKAIQPEGVGDLLDLADEYLSGWRPNRRDFAP
jgi:hypothetical protein